MAMEQSLGPAGLRRIEHVAAEAPLEEMVALYERDRVLVIDELADAEMLRELRAELEFPLAATPRSAREDDFMGLKTQRLSSLVAHIPTCRPWVAHPLILKLMERIVGKKGNIQLNATQILVLHPGERKQRLHRDLWVWKDLQLSPAVEYEVNCMWALSDFTVENGATHIVPDSFDLPDPTNIDDGIELEDGRLPDGRALSDLDTLQTVMTAGSVCLWSGAVYHGGGENGSDSPRMGMTLSYTPVGLRQEENQFLVVPPEVARELPEPLQKLLGYELGNYALGFVDGMQSPMTLLR